MHILQNVKMGVTESVGVAESVGGAISCLSDRVMWLFNRSSTAADTDNSDLKEVTHAQRQRNKQIEWLREKVNG